ncbi:hypothetical protein PAMP_021802 [Pampus punctatissimus]
MDGWWMFVGALAGILAAPRGIHGACVYEGSLYASAEFSHSGSKVLQFTGAQLSREHQDTSVATWKALNKPHNEEPCED